MTIKSEKWNDLEKELNLGLPIPTLSKLDIALKWQKRAIAAEEKLKNANVSRETKKSEKPRFNS